MPYPSNSEPSDVTQVDVTHVAGDQLRSIVERIERLNEDVKAINDDKKEVYQEAKGNGYDTAIIKKIIQRRSKDAASVAEEDAIMEVYLQALGMPG